MTIKIDKIEIDTELGTAVFENQVYILSRKNFLLLCYFHQRRGTVITRAELEEKFFNPLSKSNSIAVHISRLRSKFGGLPSLRKVYGVGYILEIPEQSCVPSESLFLTSSI